MRAEPHILPAPYRVVVLTLDRHAAGPAARVAPRLARDFPGLTLDVHAAAEWGERPEALAEARAAIASADILIVTLLFLDEHVRAILPDLAARRDRCDALVAMVADTEIVRLTRMGDLDMSRPALGVMALLKKLRPKPQAGAGGRSAGAGHMRMLRRLPRILKLVPGRAQDLRQWFLSMQYWLGGSDGNVENLVRALVSRYAAVPAWRRTAAAAPVEHPEVGLYHPDLPGSGIAVDAARLPNVRGAVGTVGVLMLRSYVLSGDTAHYDAVIRALTARGLDVVPAFAGGLDGRPAIAAYMDGGRVDALLSLTGFSLVGGPAYNDAAAAAEVLGALDVPYLNAQPLEFQTLGQWAASPQGLGSVEATMLLALPEIDGAVAPTVFAGRHGPAGCDGCARRCRPAAAPDLATTMAPCPERVDVLAGKVARLASLRAKANADKDVAIVLFGFPPNAGAAGTAAYLDVFASLHATLTRMAAEGYDVAVPATVEDLRTAVLSGGAAYGQEASIAAYLPADRLVAELDHLGEIEAAWGPAPGRAQSDGAGVYVLGARFGRVFVGLQPAFGYEGDPMRLLFERGFAPTHAFAGFYHWIRRDLAADAILHFGMHGALEFMPGKQAGLSGADWPDRLIGGVPNVYLYAANNPSEATLAKRRSDAVTVTHLTPPLASAGLYKGLAELKDSVARLRGMDPFDPARADLAALVAEQAAAVDMDGGDAHALWAQLVEAEAALIPEGLHVLGRAPTPEARARMVALMDGADAAERARAEALLAGDHELPGLMRALSARFVAPVPGGDLVRNPDVLPTGRNIHAFDPFRMPTAFAMRQGAAQAQLLLDAHPEAPRSVALVLWGSDNIKSDGTPIAQALALMGCAPRFDAWGRLAGAELVPLERLGRARIDVVVTLSGIFRDLLPLQTKLLAEAALICAQADEPLHLNHVRANALAHVERTGCDIATAALRVFSNAEGAYGSNVNQLVDASAFEDEDELADAYQARKGFAYGADGRAAPQPEVLAAALAGVDLAYQNLESIELGVTSVDHYFDTLGGIARAARRAKGGAPLPVYIGDATRGTGKVRTLAAQVALETRSRSLNPRFYEPLLSHGAEGVRQIEAHVTNTVGWSATTGQVDPWVYQRLSETFVLDQAMRERLAALNPQASARMAGRLIEAAGRDYWAPDEATLAGLHEAADAIEDRLEGIAAE